MIAETEYREPRAHTREEIPLLIKERLDLPRELRGFDEQVEQIELQLRSVVNARLDSKPEAVPGHVSQKVSERIARTVARNPGVDTDFLKGLAGQLEYFDPREIQDTITSKALWHTVEPASANKEILIAKLSQLAELRNALRHSRSTDEITRKEGEAAIIWFGQIIGGEQPVPAKVADG